MKCKNFEPRTQEKKIKDKVFGRTYFRSKKANFERIKMLTDRERMIALVNNLEHWDWTLYPTYPVEKEYAEVIAKVMRKEAGMPERFKNE